MSDFSKNWRCEWLVQVINHGYCEPALWRFSGSEEEMREKLVELVISDRNEDSENWWYGTEKVDDVEGNGSWELYASGQYDDGKRTYQIEYIATKLAHVELLR